MKSFSIIIYMITITLNAATPFDKYCSQNRWNKNMPAHYLVFAKQGHGFPVIASYSDFPYRIRIFVNEKLYSYHSSNSKCVWVGIVEVEGGKDLEAVNKPLKDYQQEIDPWYNSQETIEDWDFNETSWDIAKPPFPPVETVKNSKVEIFIDGPQNAVVNLIICEQEVEGIVPIGLEVCESSSVSGLPDSENDENNKQKTVLNRLLRGSTDEELVEESSNNILMSNSVWIWVATAFSILILISLISASVTLYITLRDSLERHRREKKTSNEVENIKTNKTFDTEQNKTPNSNKILNPAESPYITAPADSVTPKAT